MLPAVFAAVRHGLMVFALDYAEAAAVGAAFAVAPAFFFKVETGRFFAGELAEKFVKADGFWLVHFAPLG